MTIQVPKGYITMAEARKHSMITDSVLRRLAREEAFQALKAGGRWYVEPESFRGYLHATGQAANLLEPINNRPGPDYIPDRKPPPRA